MFDDKTEEITDLSFEGGITLDFKLKEWGTDDKSILAKLCNEIDRKYLSNRIPYPYTEDDAIWWLNMVNKQEGKDGIFRAINNFSQNLAHHIYKSHTYRNTV